MMKAMVLALGLAAVLAAVIGLSLVAVAPGGTQAQGQAGPAAPANVRAVDGAETGQAVLLWDAVADAAYYRIGWVNMETFRAVQAEGGREWLDVFAFYDVVNRRQTAQTITDLAPGVEYAFIMASVGQRFGGATGWSEWTYLTTATADATSCPTDGGTPPVAPGGSTPTPTPTPEPGATLAATETPAPTPTPVGIDYDTDDDGLIEISTLAQLDAVRHDLDGDGASAHAGHAAAFPDAMREMGCLDGCSGYELAVDLDFDTNGNGRRDAGDAHWDDGDGWLPVGDPGETRFQYNAVFDGNDHVIANLFIDWRDADHVGLFRATGEDAEIRNVRLTGVRVSGRNQVGGLVGSNGGSVSGSSVAGRVSGAGDIGGLVGSNSGGLSNSSASAEVTGESGYVGGLAGRNTGIIATSYASGEVEGEGGRAGGLAGYSEGAITASHATGSVSGERGSVGGLVGTNYGSIASSYATGAVGSEGDYVGGLVGNGHGAITGSYAAGDVTGRIGVGGLIGYNGRREHPLKASVVASYATGGVTGYDDVGGLIGVLHHYGGSITASYAIGRVTVRSTSGAQDVGGLVGEGTTGTWQYSYRVTDSYWDTQSSGQSNSKAGVGKTTREMQSPTGPTGIYANWNAEWWDFGTSRQYPVLKYEGMDVAAQRR